MTSTSSSTEKVAEIFLAAGEAFKNLGELTLQLHPNAEVPPHNKWTANEINMLHAAVKKFNGDLNKMAEEMKNRTISQMKSKLREESSIDVGDNEASEDEPPPAKKSKTESKPSEDLDLVLPKVDADDGSDVDV